MLADVEIYFDLSMLYLYVPTFIILWHANPLLSNDLEISYGRIAVYK
jgi:hypothetical protein